jgi:hypothetical protein
MSANLMAEDLDSQIKGLLDEEWSSRKLDT